MVRLGPNRPRSSAADDLIRDTGLLRMLDDGLDVGHKRAQTAILGPASLYREARSMSGRSPFPGHFLVEPTGIEPVTSCLQNRRGPSRVVAIGRQKAEPRGD